MRDRCGRLHWVWMEPAPTIEWWFPAHRMWNRTNELSIHRFSVHTLVRLVKTLNVTNGESNASQLTWEHFFWIWELVLVQEVPKVWYRFYATFAVGSGKVVEIHLPPPPAWSEAALVITKHIFSSGLSVMLRYFSGYEIILTVVWFYWWVGYKGGCDRPHNTARDRQGSLQLLRLLLWSSSIGGHSHEHMRSLVSSFSLQFSCMKDKEIQYLWMFFCT